MGTFNCILDIVSGRDKVMALCKWQKLGKTELPMTSVELNLSILSSAKTREMWRWREKPAAHAMWHPNFPLTKVGWSSVLLSVLTQGCRQIPIVSVAFGAHSLFWRQMKPCSCIWWLEAWNDSWVKERLWLHRWNRCYRTLGTRLL